MTNLQHTFLQIIVLRTRATIVPCSIKRIILKPSGEMRIDQDMGIVKQAVC